MIPYLETFGEILFTHEDEDGTQRVFAVERILNWIKQNPQRVFLIPIHREFAYWMLGNRGIENQRLVPLLNFCSLEPTIWCSMEDETQTHLLIDGSHRYVAAAIQSSTHILGCLLPKIVWEQFLVSAPKVDIVELSKSYSRIKPE